MNACRNCQHHRVGPLTGMAYCASTHAGTEPGDLEHCHAMRLPQGPCRPEARLFVSIAAQELTAAQKAWVAGYDAAAGGRREAA